MYCLNPKEKQSFVENIGKIVSLDIGTILNMVQPLWKLLKILKINLHYDPATTLLCIYLFEKDTFRSIFIVAYLQ